MRKFFFIFLLSLFFGYSYSQSNVSVSQPKDNFYLYLFGVQSELLGNYPYAQNLYNISSYTDDNKVYYPSLLSNINLRLLSGDYGAETEKLISTIEPFISDSNLLVNMKIDFFMGREDYDSAEKLCSYLLSLNPNDHKAVKILSLIQFSRDSLDSALEMINDFESLQSVDYSLYSVKREILAKKELYDSLLSYNLRISDLYPENLSILSDLADVYTALGKDSLAYNLWNSIISQDPNSLELLYKSNRFYATRKFPSETITTAFKLLSSELLVPKAKEDVFNNIFISFDITKDSVYLNLLDSNLVSIANLEKDTTVVHEMALGYYYFRKDYNRSFLLLDGMISSEKPGFTPFLQKANLLNELGNFEQSISVLDSATLIFPHVPNFPLYKAELIKDKLGEKDAIKFINNAIKKETEDTTKSQYLAYIADIYFKLGKHKQSFKLYDLSLELSPDNSLALNNYAYFLALSDHNLDKALVMSHKANSLSKNNSTYLDTEAYILYKLGMYSEAKKLMDLAFSLEDRDFSAELYLHYADILSALGNKILSKNYYQKALELGGDEKYINERLNSIE